MSSGGSSSPGPKRKFQRNSVVDRGAAGTFDMGCDGAFAMLKSEARSISTAGVAWCLTDYPKNLVPILHPYLSGTVARPYKDDGSAHIEHNNGIIDDYSAEVAAMPTCGMTGTVALQLDAEKSLNVYCKLVESLKIGNTATDGMPKFFLDARGKKSDVGSGVSGGFQHPYNLVNVPIPELSKEEQERCVFRMKNKTKFEDITGTYGKDLLKEVHSEARRIYKHNFSTVALDLLFHWNKHSFFTYHQDTDGDYACIVNLSHGESDFHVAGKETAVYTGIGSAHLFPTKLFHRSGSATKRCVKVAIFLKRGEEVNISDDEDEAPAGSSSTAPGHAPNPGVKAEKKTDESDGSDTAAAAAKAESSKD